MRSYVSPALLILLLFAVVTATLAEEDLLTTTPRTDHLGDPLPEQALRRFGTRRFQHFRGVNELLLTANEQIVVCTAADSVFGWSTESGKPLWQTSIYNPEYRGSVRAAAYGVRALTHFSGTGQMLVVRGPEVFSIDPTTGRTEVFRDDFPFRLNSVDVSPDGQRVAVGGEHGLFLLTSDGDTVTLVENDPDDPLSGNYNTNDRLKFGGDFSYGRFSPDGRFLAVVNSEQPEAIQLLTASEGVAVRKIDTQARVVRLDFSPDGRYLATTERDIAARLYDVDTGQRVWQTLFPQAGRSESYTSCIAFRPDGKQIAVGAPLGSDVRIRLLNPDDGEETGSLSGSGWKPWTVNYTADSQLLYGSGWDGTVRRWRVHTEEQLPLPGGIRSTPVCAMSPATNDLCYVDDRDRIHLVNLDSGKTTQQLLRPATKWDQVAFSPDATQLAAGGSTADRMILVIWHVADGQTAYEFSWPKGDDSHSGIEALAWSANGARIATASFRQDEARVWDLNTERLVARVRHRRVYGMDLSDDGGTLVTAGWDKVIRTWSCDGGTPLQERNLSDGNWDTRMYGVRFSRDESLIATVDMTDSIRLFDRQLNAVHVIRDAGDFSFGALQFSQNDLWIAVGTHKGVCVFDIATGTLLWRNGDHWRSVYTVDFGRDDRTLLSGGGDGICYLWSLDSSKGLSSFENVPPEELFGRLVGVDPKDAYLAWFQLQQHPVGTVELLRDSLLVADQEEISDTRFRRTLLMLAAKRTELRQQAEQQLDSWGLSGYERLLQAIQSGRSGEKKQEFLRTRRAQLTHRYRRAIALLRSFGTEDARKAERTIRESCSSRLIQQLLDAPTAQGLMVP